MVASYVWDLDGVLRLLAAEPGVGQCIKINETVMYCDVHH